MAEGRVSVKVVKIINKWKNIILCTYTSVLAIVNIYHPLPERKILKIASRVHLSFINSVIPVLISQTRLLYTCIHLNSIPFLCSRFNQAFLSSHSKQNLFSAYSRVLFKYFLYPGYIVSFSLPKFQTRS